MLLLPHRLEFHQQHSSDKHFHHLQKSKTHPNLRLCSQRSNKCRESALMLTCVELHHTFRIQLTGHRIHTPAVRYSSLSTPLNSYHTSHGTPPPPRSHSKTSYDKFSPYPAAPEPAALRSKSLPSHVPLNFRVAKVPCDHHRRCHRHGYHHRRLTPFVAFMTS